MKLPRAAAPAIVAALTLSGCTRVTSIPPAHLSPAPSPAPPGLLPPPALTFASPVLVEARSTAELLGPRPALGPVDEILASPAALEPGLRERIDWWVDHWSGSGAGWFGQYLERMAELVEVVDTAVAARGLPGSLRYLPIIESGYNPAAVSGARAVGLWQIMGPTAHDFGLEVDALVDERRDPFRATDVALSYLQSLRERFGSWYLALAAYNAGPARVQRVLDRYAPLAPRGDSLFWRLRGHLPHETREFVPKFLGAVAVAQRPETHGLGQARAPDAFRFDEVWVPDATTLDVVARAAEASEAEIHRLNPQIVRGITPPGKRVRVRVPLGRSPAFEANYPSIPPGDRVTFVEHRVRAGETLSHIADRYKLPLFELRAANPDVRERYLQIGERVTVPIAPSAARGVSQRD